MESFPVLIKQLERISQVKPEEIEQMFLLLSKQIPELWRKLVIGAYLDDEINLSKAAELLEKHPTELRRDFQSQGIPIKIGVRSLDEVNAELQLLKSL